MCGRSGASCGPTLVGANLLLESVRRSLPDEETYAAWRYLEDYAFQYPDGLDVKPMRPGRVGQKRAHYVGCEAVVKGDVGGVGGELIGLLVDDIGPGAILEDVDDDTGPERIARLLFSSGRRGHTYVFLRGGRCELHAIFRRCFRAWSADGYTVACNIAGTYVRSLTVRKGKHAWYLVDFPSLVGAEEQDGESLARAYCGPGMAGCSRARLACIASGIFALVVREQFGVEAASTAGRTAVAALARSLPQDGWLWRPSAMAVTLARLGGGYRGGYCYYPAYRGPGHRIDIRRAYVWALSQELPNGTAAGYGRTQDGEARGIFVCRVRGPGYVPVYLAPFSGASEGFRRRLWNGDSCICVLPSSEFAGLRALGFIVEPGYGCVFRGRADFSGFVRQVTGLTERYGADTPQGLVGKALGVRVYGKLAEASRRTEVTIAEDAPGEDFYALLDAAGDEVESAWVAERTGYRSHQHVDLAAVITGHVRSRLYAMAADLMDHGLAMISADTDGMIVSGRPAWIAEANAAGIGDWRYCGYDPDIIINGPRFAVIGGRVLVAGTSPQAPNVVALAHDNGTVTVDGVVGAAPWKGGTGVRTVRRVLRRA